MAMSTEAIGTADLLRLAQWTSPAFPTSSYAYSHGLEAAVASGAVHDAATCEGWAAAALRFGGGALDAWAIRAVMAGSDPDGVAHTLRARAGCAERWRETRDQGVAFGATAQALAGGAERADPLPVALGLAARGMDPEAVCALHLHGFAAQMVSAAQRLVPLGQTAAQGALARLHPVIAAVAAREWDGPPGGAAALADLDAMRHEALQPRMFRT